MFALKIEMSGYPTFEEGTSAAWLYDLLKPHVTKLVVCDPRKNKSMREGNQSDKIDARRLAELLRLDHLTPVYHGEHGLRTLKELVRSYLTVTKDLARVMTRVKAIYRSWAIPYTGKQVYASRHRAEWLGKINEPGVCRRAEFYYQQLDALRTVRQQVRRELLAEGKKHKAWKRLCQIPSIGPIRAAVLLGKSRPSPLTVDNDAHAAASELFEDAIVGDGLADHGRVSTENLLAS